MAAKWIQTWNKNKECKPVKTIINNLLTFSLSAHDSGFMAWKWKYNVVHEVISRLQNDRPIFCTNVPQITKAFPL